jgi:hypothetical protein
VTIRLFAGVGKGPDGAKLAPVEVPSQARVGGQSFALVATPAAGPDDAPTPKAKPTAKGR